MTYDSDYDNDDWAGTPPDLEPWELQWVHAMPPFAKLFKLERCRRQELTNKIAQRLQFPGSGELSMETHQLLWDLYEAMVGAYSLRNLRAEDASLHLEEAFDAGRAGYTFGELREIARDRGLSGYQYSTTVESVSPDLERMLVGKLSGPTRALVHSALGQRGKRRRHKKAS